MKTNRLLKSGTLVLALFGLLATLAPAQNVTATFTNAFGDGIWERNQHIGVIGNPGDPNVAGNWDTGAYPNNGNFIIDPNTSLPVPGPNPLYDVVINTPMPCTLGTNIGVAVQTLNLAGVSTLNLKGGATVAVTNGPLTNNGSILVNSNDPANNTANLRFDHDGTLTGNGVVTLNGIGFNRGNFNLNGQTVTHGANHTIHGRGTVLGQGSSVLINNGTIIGDHLTDSMQVDLSNTANQNNGTFKAINGGLLGMYSGAIDQTGGGIFLADAGTLEFGCPGCAPVPQTATVIGGSLNTVNGGVIKAYLLALQSSINNGAIQIGPGDVLAVTGTGLTNNNSILVNTTGENNTSKIRFDASGALNGSGTVTLNSFGNSFNTADLDLQNFNVTHGPNHLTHGRGTIIGFAGATFINNGTIIGDDPAGSMQLDLANTANQNNSLIKATNGGVVSMSGGTIDQTSGGTLVADGSGSFVQFYVANNGTNIPTVIGGTLNTANGGMIGPAPIANQGVILQGCTNSGNIQIPPSDFILVTGAGLTNNGAIKIGDGSVTDTSKLRFDQNGTLDGTGNVLLQGIGTTFNVADLDLQNFTVTQGVTHRVHGKGTIIGFGGATFINRGTVEGDDPTGTMQVDLANTSNQNSGTFRATNGGLLGLYSGTVNQTGAGTFLADGGTIELDGGQFPTVNGGTLNTANGGVIRAGNVILGGNITNSGMCEIRSGGATLSNATSLTNDGTITLAAGDSLLRFDQNNTAITGAGFIVLTNDAKMQISGGQAVTNGSGHTVKGNGTIQVDGGGSFTNSGIVSPGLSPGKITVIGNYVQGSTGVLNMEIGGGTPVTEYDQLAVNGTATLDGTLNVTLIDGFRPNVGDVFQIITPASFAGAFSAIHTIGFTGQVNYNAGAITITVLTVPDIPLNIATRLRVNPDPNQLIGGVIITGTQPKRVLIRAIGPSLSSFFSGALADPTLELFQGNTLLESNNNWRDTNQAAIDATGIPPTDDLESAIVRTLAPGAYTAIVRGHDGTSGIGLVEVYDLDLTAKSKLANIATRGFVDTDDNVMIGGFIMGGSGGENGRVVIRAIGPSLTAVGIAGALQDPVLELHDANGSTLQVNDDWQSTQQAEIEATGLAPTDIHESAIVTSLLSGNYTAIVRGKNNTTGVAVVEVYNIL